MQFPQIPEQKKYNNRSHMTPEQEAMLAAINDPYNLSKKNEKILRECRDFYLKALKFLKNIDLSKINEKDAKDIKSYLNTIFNYRGVLRNNIYFKYLYRITLVRDHFLEDGKVRDPGFIGYPPLDIIKKIGIYGRANSTETTVLYCSFSENIALLEAKPRVGDRIIISEWIKESDEPFVSYPILSNNIQINEGLVKAYRSLDKTLSGYPDLLKRINMLYFDFIGGEFVKDIPVVHINKFEYLFSAYFSDKVLTGEENKAQDGNNFQYDCIIYPSIAAKHRTDNLAIHPNSVHKLRINSLRDGIVTATNYDNCQEEDFDINSQISVIGGKETRILASIENGRIIWSDD
jgi:hypothetical protein